MSSVDTSTFFSLSPSDSSVHTASDGSPALSSSHMGLFTAGSGSLQLSDEDLLFDESLGSIEPASGKAASSRKSARAGGGKRVLNNTAERKEIHNKIERQRRENLNTKFLDLAAQLPNMAGVKRTSKSVIVHKSLAFINDAQVREAHLVKQSEDLYQEVQALRARLGLSPRQALAPLPSYTTGMPVMQSVTTASLHRSDSISSQGSDPNDGFHFYAAATASGASDAITTSAPIDLSPTLSASWTSQSSYSASPAAVSVPAQPNAFQVAVPLPSVVQQQPMVSNPMSAYANADFSSIFQSILGTGPTTQQQSASAVATESYPPMTGFEFAGIPAPDFSFGGGLRFQRPSSTLFASA